MITTRDRFRALCNMRADTSVNRYFFDFDNTPDEYGILMSSTHKAVDEALQSMAENLAELLASNCIRAETTCGVRENDKTVSFKIVMTMHVEDGNGTAIEAPFDIER